MTAWLIRAGREARYASDWFANGYIAIYWQLNDLDIAGAARQEVRDMVDAIYADSSQQARAMITGQVHRFGSVMQTGDDVVTYSPKNVSITSAPSPVAASSKTPPVTTSTTAGTHAR